MPTLSFPGSYEDDRGVETIVWRIEPSNRYGPRMPRYEIHTAIRSVDVWGLDFDGLEPNNPDPGNVERLSLDTAGELNGP